MQFLLYLCPLLTWNVYPGQCLQQHVVLEAQQARKVVGLDLDLDLFWIDAIVHGSGALSKEPTALAF
jgi:hypothetical protein